jgi:prevent-host-death family protein
LLVCFEQDATMQLARCNAQLAFWPEDSYKYGHKIWSSDGMRFASVAEIKNRLSEYLARARRRREPIIVTRHGKPYALIQPLDERDLEDLDWSAFRKQQLARAWAGEDDGLYDYL